MTDGRGETARWGLSAWCGAVALYLLFNVATQLAVSPTANYDQAEMLVLAQELRLGYNAQPPLYVWLSALPDALAGPSLALNLALKCVLMTACVALSLAALRDAGGSRAQAPLVLAGFALIPVVVWESQRVLTHTVLAVVLVLAVLWQAQRLRSVPSRLRYLGWGLLGGAALISKYNTAIPLAALVGALLLAPGWRCVMLTSRLAWAALGAALVTLPHLMWLAGNAAAVAPTLRKLDRTADTFGFLPGLADLAGALAACAAGMTIAWIAVRVVRLIRARVATAGAGTHLPVVAPGPASLRRLVSIQLALGVVLSVVFVIATESRHFEERWLLPVLAPLPLWLALSVRRPDLRLGMITVGTLLALIAALLLPGRVLFAERMARARPPVLNLPYGALAGAMRAAHGTPAAIFADTQTLAGNLRLAFPRARIVVPGVTRHQAPPVGAIWAVHEDSDCEGRSLTPRVDQQQLVPVAGLPCEVYEAPLLHHRDRTHRLYLQVLRATRGESPPAVSEKQPSGGR